MPSVLLVTAQLSRFSASRWGFQSNWGLPLPKTHANGAHPVGNPKIANRPSGRSSVVEHDLAKVGVEGSNPFARSKSLDLNNLLI